MSPLRPARRSSLRARLLGRVLAGVTMLWMLAAVLAWVDTRRELDSLLDGHLAQSAALLIALQLEDGGEAALPPASNLHRYSPRVAFQVWRDGVLEMHSWNAPADPLAPLVPGFHATHLSGRDWRVYAARPRQASDAIVLIGELGYSREEILEAVLRSSLLPLLVALPLLGLSVWWAVRLGLVPLDRLGRELATRDPAELTPVRIDDAPAELLPLIQALNELFDRTHALLSSERRFTADAAHELRTPIAGIRAQAQAALAVADPAARRHALQATLAGCDRATRLVQQLLTLARLEAEPQCRQGRADLVALARDEVVEIAATAFEGGVTQSVTPIPLADADNVDAWVKALYAAAVKAATKNGTIRARVRRLPDTIFTSIDMWSDIGAMLDIAAINKPGMKAGDAGAETFAGSILKFPRIMVPGLPAGTVVVGRKNQFEFYEERIGLLSAVVPRVLGVEIAYGGYMAAGFLDASTFAKITVAEA